MINARRTDDGKLALAECLNQFRQKRNDGKQRDNGRRKNDGRQIFIAEIGVCKIGGHNLNGVGDLGRKNPVK